MSLRSLSLFALGSSLLASVNSLPINSGANVQKEKRRADVDDLVIIDPIRHAEWEAGREHTVAWRADSDEVREFGDREIQIELWTGNSTDQTLLAELGKAKAADLAAPVTIDPAVGPNGPYYYIHIRSADPPVADDDDDDDDDDHSDDTFSSIFALTDATGTFNQTVQDQINNGVSLPSDADIDDHWHDPDVDIDLDDDWDDWYDDKKRNI